jgi:hypothetical protein
MAVDKSDPRVRMIQYWCGIGGRYLVEKEVAVVETENSQAVEEQNHCTRCLLAKQIKHGEAYMKEHGYPIQKRRRLADHS